MISSVTRMQHEMVVSHAVVAGKSSGLPNRTPRPGHASRGMICLAAEFEPAISA